MHIKCRRITFLYKAEIQLLPDKQAENNSKGLLQALSAFTVFFITCLAITSDCRHPGESQAAGKDKDGSLLGRFRFFRWGSTTSGMMFSPRGNSGSCRTEARHSASHTSGERLQAQWAHSGIDQRTHAFLNDVSTLKLASYLNAFFSSPDRPKKAGFRDSPVILKSCSFESVLGLVISCQITKLKFQNEQRPPSSRA